MSFRSVTLPGDEALAAWEAQRRAFAIKGEYPFLIGPTQDLELLREAAEFCEQSPDEILEASAGIDLAAWRAKRRTEAAEWEFSEANMLGEWPGEVANHGAISIHRDVLSGKVLPEVVMGFARIAEPWHLPAALKYGDWNDCPAPPVHCAQHRAWKEEYGAEIVGMSGAVVECRVGNPPRDRAAALELAWQQYWYCGDIVDQGCETVNVLAATLINSDYWFFWWD